MKVPLLIVLSGGLGVAGQVMIKHALAVIGTIPLTLQAMPGVVLRLATEPMVVAGLIVYVSGTFFWLIALSRADLSYAYPIASLNYVFVLVAAWLVLGERPTPVRLLGVFVICAGVWLLSRTRVATPKGGQVLVAQTAPRARP